MRLPTVFGLRLSVPLSLYRQRLTQRTGEEMLAAAGIAVGVALVFGVLVASTSVTSSATEAIRGVTGAARLQLSARSPDGFEQRLAGAVASLPGVENSGAVLRENAAIAGAGGTRSAQLVGLTASVSTLGGSSTRALTSGPLPEGGGLLLPGGIASAIGAKRGDTVTVLAAGRAHRIRVSDILAGPRFGPLASSPVAIAQMSIVQGLAGRPGRVTQVLVQAAPGAERRVSGEMERLAAGRLNVLSAGSETALLSEAFTPNQQSTDLFAFISALVGFLLAFNAMLLTVPERRRFVAHLRTLGYDTAQVALILVFQALVLGIASSLVGLGLGYVLSHALFDNVPTYLAFAFPISGHESASVTVLAVAFGCGLTAALGATLPAVLELRRSLDTVLQERGEGGQRVAPRVVLALAVTTIALSGIVTLLALASTSTTLACGIILAGAVVCAIPATYRFSTWLLGPVSGRLKSMLAPAVIELESASIRSIALASVAGLVLYAIIAVGGARRDVTSGLERTIAQYESTADVWVTTGNNVFDTDSFQAPGLPSSLSRLPGVASVRVYQGGLLDVGDRRLLIRAHDPSLPVMVQPLAIVHGSLARANEMIRRGGWATASEGFAGEHHLKVGDTFVLPTPSGKLRLRIAATTTNLGWPAGLITLSSADYRRAWLTSQPTALEINLAPGVNPVAGKRVVQGALASYPGLRVRTATESTKEADAAVRQGLSSLAQISTLLLVIGALAVAASLSAAIWQRRVRLASMRIWGYDRLQIWRSVLLESAILLAVGCAVGATLGLFAHALATRYLRINTGFPATFSVQVMQIVVTLVLVAVISLVVVAVPGATAAQVPPTTAFED